LNSSVLFHHKLVICDSISGHTYCYSPPGSLGPPRLGIFSVAGSNPALATKNFENFCVPRLSHGECWNTREPACAVCDKNTPENACLSARGAAMRICRK
jgi:hypothetical protein